MRESEPAEPLQYANEMLVMNLGVFFFFYLVVECMDEIHKEHILVHSYEHCR